jgi:hypothetical protein
LGKSIAEVEAALGPPTTDGGHPVAEQLPQNDAGGQRTYRHGDQSLRVTFDPKTKQATEFFLPGTDRNAILRAANLSWGGGYDLEVAFEAGQPSKVTGIWVRQPVLADPSLAPTDSRITAGFRTWTDTKGKHHIEAKFQKYSNGTVVLEKVDGNAVSLPAERLSDRDQQWIRNRAKQKSSSSDSMGP